jgi:Putative addiction module component
LYARVADLTIEEFRAILELTDQQKLEIDKRLAAHDANPSRGRSRLKTI